MKVNESKKRRQALTLEKQRNGQIPTAAGGWRSAASNSKEEMSLQRGKRGGRGGKNGKVGTKPPGMRVGG